VTTYDEHLQAGDPGDPPADWDTGEPERMTEAFARFTPTEESPNLPEPIGGPDGQLDLDALRLLAPQVRDGLVASIRHSATMLRQGRGTVIVPEDTFDLVRRVTAAEEVMRQYAQAFTAAAAECVALAEEEALTANGPYPGVEEAPSGSLFVPDGEGRRIAVRPEWKAGDSTYDVATLVAWLIDEEVANLNGERRGRYSPGAKALDELRKRLAGTQRDSDAAVIRQVRSVGPRKYVGVKVTREDA
jgi:hypothetical protein